jgi:hypothetical protein
MLNFYQFDMVNVPVVKVKTVSLFKKDLIFFLIAESAFLSCYVISEISQNYAQKLDDQ